MFESRHRSGANSANRWLVVAGAGLVILAFVARMLLDIGNTNVADLAAVVRPDTAAATPTPPPPPEAATTDSTMPEAAASPSPVPEQDSAAIAPTVAATPPVLRKDTTVREGAFAVQIGAFGSEGNATKLSERASALGYPAAVIAQPRGSSTIYLVRVKGLRTAAEARLASDSLARVLRVQSVVVPPGR